MKQLQKRNKRLQKIIKSFLTDQEKIPDKANFVENEKIISDSPMGLQNNSILFITRNMFIPTIKICFTLEFYWYNKKVIT